MANLIGKLPRCSLTRLLPGATGDGNETLFAQFNPNQLRERIRVDYATVMPRRGSHEILNYTGTRSERIPLELFFTGIDRDRTQAWGRLTSRLTNTGNSGHLSPPERFLKSCCYSDTRRKMFVPPTVIFNWPRIVRMRMKIQQAEFRWEHFSQRDGSGLILVCRLRFIEVPGTPRLQSSFIRSHGGIHVDAGTFEHEVGLSQAGTEGRQQVRSPRRTPK